MPLPPTDSTLPGWAVVHTNAALQIGLSVPEIEKQLVGKGLSPTSATAVTTWVLESRILANHAAVTQGERSGFIHRIASLLVVLLCLLLAYFFNGGLSVARTFLGILGPLACIWYPEVMEESVPPQLLRGVAWLLLLVIAGYRIVLLMLSA